jgi:hypothetical protein
MSGRIMSGVCAVLVCACLSPGCGNSSDKVAGEPAQSRPQTSSGPVDTCALLSASEIAAIVGNPVDKGQPFAGPEVCTWNAEPGRVTALLTVRRVGSERAKVLCAELGKGADAGQRVEGLGDVAAWKFSNTMGLFNSGDLETCSGKAYVSVSLNGKQDEAKLKEASLAIVQKVLQGL